MKFHKTHTAVFLFTRQPAEEWRHKKLLGNRNNGIALAEHLIHQSIAQVEKSGIDYFVLSTDQQRGNTFAERLRAAFEDVFQKGYEKVIAIGNDTPSLTDHDLVRAASYLRNGHLALGPSRDGGVYLLGLSRTLFDLIDFDSIPWSTRSVYLELCHQGDLFGAEALLLSPQHDIDREDDLTDYKNREKSPFARVVRQLTEDIQHVKDSLDPVLHTFFILPSLLRAPPLFYGGED